jgi:hypothetical protein
MLVVDALAFVEIDSVYVVSLYLEYLFDFKEEILGIAIAII